MRYLLWLLFLISCTPSSQVIVGDNTFTVSIADTPDEWAYGLMNTTSLGSDEGMLFVFDQPAKRSFWMKDTLIPLDIIFIDESMQVDSIHRNAQPCVSAPCEVYTSNKEILYVLELNGNRGERIQEGDIVNRLS